MEQEIEIWKNVVGYEDYYVISNLGNLKSVDRIVISTTRGTRLRYGILLKTAISTHGYKKCTISIRNKKRNKEIHRLVAEAFIPNPDNKPTVNHINGIKTDNRVENLEWNTYQENMQHAFDNGLNKSSDFQKKITSGLASREIINIITGDTFKSIKIAAMKNGIKYKTLSCYLTGVYSNKTNLRYYKP